MQEQMTIDGTPEVTPDPPLEMWRHVLIKKITNMDPEELMRHYDMSVMMAQSGFNPGVPKKDHATLLKYRDIVQNEIIARMCRAVDSQWDFVPPPES